MRDQNFHTAIAKVIKDTRKHLNFTQKEIAEIVKVNVRTIRHIEAGTNNTTADLLKAIAECFNLKLSTLLTKAGY